MDNCLFCKIVNGDIPSSKVYEDEHCLAFRDTEPAAPVHVLIVPKRHVANALEGAAVPGLMDHLFAAAAAVARQEGIEENGFRLVINNGERAGQSVMHLHLHLIAGRKLAWPPG